MFKKIVGAIKRKALAVCVAVSVAAMTAVSAFATAPSTPFADENGIIDPSAFDPLVTGVTGNVGAVMPKVLIVVALLLGITIVIALFKKNARPGNN